MSKKELSYSQLLDQMVRNGHWKARELMEALLQKQEEIQALKLELALANRKIKILEVELEIAQDELKEFPL